MTRSIESIRADIARVSKEPCRCVWGPDPGEYECCDDLLVEICGCCQLLQDLDDEMEEAVG